MAVMSNPNVRSSEQEGGALLIFTLILALAVIASLFSILDGSSVKVERDKANAKILSDAKVALLGYAIGAIGTGQRPGDLIRPDFASESPANYDGSVDGGCLNVLAANGLPLINNSVDMRCLGRLPWKDLGISISGSSEHDPTGIMPWYAISANLVSFPCLAVLNSNTLNLINSAGPLDCTGATLPYPWLTLRDGSGNVVSNRVAAIIFVPNVARGGQTRSITPLGMANQYLDTLVVPAGCAAPCVPGTYSNADMDNDFIFSSEGSPIAADSNFNDQLLYITIDELMLAVEKRIAGEVRKQLNSYRATNGFFPDAATIGYQGQSCVQGQNTGFLPLPILSCDGSKCDSAFPAVMQFTSDYNYALSSGACTHTAKVCSCTGQGACIKASLPKRSFSCDSNGMCVSNIASSVLNPFNYSPSAPIDATSLAVTSGSCVVVGTGVNCTGAGKVQVNGVVNSCTAPLITGFPNWFFDNGWKHYIYYAKGILGVGVNSATSLVVTTGAKFPSQSRPSGLISDYLDSIENTNGDMQYDAIGTPITSTYNDQMVIVAP